MYPDPTEVDPEGHRIVFENEHVRILEIQHDQGRELPLHTHVPRVIIPIGTYQMESSDPEGEKTIIDRHPGQATWMDVQHHSAEVVARPTHVIEVEIKSAAPPSLDRPTS